MKVSKNCGIDNQGCFSDKEVKLRNGAASRGDANSDNYKVILADGTSVGLSIGTIEVDIDGPNKGPTQLGYDMFLFTCRGEEIVPFSFRTSTFSELLNNLKQNGEGYSASLWVINYDNMDYLKLNSSGKCPNGTTPTEQNPRCK